MGAYLQALFLFLPSSVVQRRTVPRTRKLCGNSWSRNITVVIPWPRRGQVVAPELADAACPVSLTSAPRGGGTDSIVL